MLVKLLRKRFFSKPAVGSDPGRQMKAQYRNLFSSEDGQAVLLDLAVRFRVFDSEFVSTERTQYRAGCKAPIMFIIDVLEDSELSIEIKDTKHGR